MKLYILEMLDTWDNPMYRFVGAFSSPAARQEYIDEDPPKDVSEGLLAELRLTTVELDCPVMAESEEETIIPERPI